MVQDRRGQIMIKDLLWLHRRWKFALELKLHRLLVLEELLLGLGGLQVLNLSCHILLYVLPFSGLLALDGRFGYACFDSFAAFACQR